MVQDESTSFTNTQLSDCMTFWNDTTDAGEQQSAYKYKRFELENDDFETLRALPSRQAINVHIYVANQISTRDIHEKICF